MRLACPSARFTRIGSRLVSSSEGPCGSAADELFDIQRRRIIDDLSSNTNDKSLAGGLDQRIRMLVEAINSDASYVTLSSCSGRVSLFHRQRNELVTNPAELPSLQQPRKKRGTGLGTLFQSHDPAHDPADAASSTQIWEHVEGRLTKLTEAIEGFRRQESIVETTSNVVLEEILQLKFEPMILHVMCRDMQAAHTLLTVANEAGQRRSGLLSFRLPSTKGLSHRQVASNPPRGNTSACPETKKITVSISSAIGMDVPLMIRTPRTGASWSYSQDEPGNPERMLLRHLLLVSETMFAENFRRTQKLLNLLARNTV